VTSPVERPAVGVVIVVRRGDRVLLAQRSRGLYGGQWGFPGGHIERGETIIDAAMRELDEETGIAADPLGVLTPFDVIERDATGTVIVHYVLLAVLARWRAGEGIAADDAAALRWLSIEEIAAGAVAVLPDVERIARLAFSRPCSVDGNARITPL
jgi:ADP-ribose pyrophosphatase YjhB (NUDIX family)